MRSHSASTSSMLLLQRVCFGCDKKIERKNEACTLLNFTIEVVSSTNSLLFLPFSGEHFAVSNNIGVITLGKSSVRFADLFSFGSSRYLQNSVRITVWHSKTRRIQCNEMVFASVGDRTIHQSANTGTAPRPRQRPNGKGTYTISPDAVVKGLIRKLVSSAGSPW